MTKHFDYGSALNSLYPNCNWILRGTETLENLEWNEKDVPVPTKAELDLEIIRLKAEWASTEYQRLRAAEYPDFKDYLDGIVKGDQAQVQAYIDACNAVKDKYPKPLGE